MWFVRRKTGSIFAVGLVLVTLMVCSFTLYTTQTKSRESTIVELSESLNSLNLQSEAREGVFYIQSSGRLASQQARYEVSQNRAGVSGGSCTVDLDSGSVIWGSSCELDSAELESFFLGEFREAFENRLMGYEDTFQSVAFPGEVSVNYSGRVRGAAKNFVFSLVGGELNAESSEKLAYVYGPLTYFVDPCFVLQLKFPLSKLERLYDVSSDVVENCKSESDVVSCAKGNLDLEVGRLGLEELTIVESGSLLLFSVKTADMFFYDGGFESVEFKYAFGL